MLQKDTNKGKYPGVWVDILFYRLQCQIPLITLFTDNHHLKSIEFKFNAQR